MFFFPGYVPERSPILFHSSFSPLSSSHFPLPSRSAAHLHKPLLNVAAGSVVSWFLREWRSVREWHSANSVAEFLSSFRASPHTCHYTVCDDKRTVEPGAARRSRTSSATRHRPGTPRQHIRHGREVHAVPRAAERRPRNAGAAEVADAGPQVPGGLGRGS